MSTGGPAFPGTLLDWMAGQALNGILANPETALLFDDVHRLAYDHATAMLAEKARREADHSGETNKMVEDHFRGAAEMTELEAQNRELVERIKRLEEALDRVTFYAQTGILQDRFDAIKRIAKEAKP